jgi:hypothetical protein
MVWMVSMDGVWITTRDVRYVENGKFLISFGTESKDF